MELEINNKKQTLYFGVGFVRELDQVAGIKSSGMTFGMGLSITIPALSMFDPAALSDVIYSATVTNSPRVAHEEVDGYVDTLDEKKLEKLFNDVQKEVNSANALKVALKNLKA